MLALSADTPCLTNFRSLRPARVAPQAETLEWLAQMHTEAERRKSGADTGFDASLFHTRIRKLLYRCGCSPERIGSRAHEVAGDGHAERGETPIYDVTVDPNGASSEARTKVYAHAAAEAVQRLYLEESVPPRDLLHVTCTGYASPSAAQSLVARRGWGRQTRVTHVYHMGCYASLPAVRIARGFLACAPESEAALRVDVVHNELCTLHMHPADHSPEQLVVQSLFADGHIRYSVVRNDVARREAAGHSLSIIAARDEVLPDSADAMTWAVSDHGMHMTLSRDVPARIADAARGFVAALFADANMHFAEDAPAAVFAVHPGGPKVIDVVQRALELSDAQVAVSRQVLFDYGNMSSATLPHIWMKLLAARDLPAATPIVSVAFGPGLTVSGAIMVKT
jgi:predicted naringenin-chalcone synthase